MNKKEFIDDMMEKIKEIPTSDILSTRITLVQKGMNHHALCPFHHDKHMGSFSANDHKGIWKCFSCDIGGDGIKFIAEMDEINYLEAGFKVALMFNVITDEQYDTYFNHKRYSKDDVKKIEERYIVKEKKELKKIAPVEVLDAVFRLFIESSRLMARKKSGKMLLPEDETMLKDVRGLTDKRIDEGLYFTFPNRWVLKDFTARINKAFPKKGMDILKDVPGFFYDTKEERYTFPKAKGIGIGIKNEYGQVIGIQIRLHEGGRYKWFSSSFTIAREDLTHGTSSGSPIDVVYPEVVTNRNIIITEGRFKAEQIAKEVGSITISVQGITTWRKVVQLIKRLPQAVEKMCEYQGDKPFTIHTIMTAFDADIKYNINVYQQLKDMTDTIEQELGYPTYYLYWDAELGKGIDDLILNGHKDKIHRYDKEQWDKKYDKLIERLDAMFGKAKQAPDEDVEYYFDIYFKEVAFLKKGELSQFHYHRLHPKKTNEEEAI